MFQIQYHIHFLESEEDLIDIKPKKRQKSKVVQSLKLKFKKEESPKYKDDQEAVNETGKSIVHVTNEELNSSEMVFFCIPEVDSSIKNLPKKKLNTKENHTQKESEIINLSNSETCGFNSFDSFVFNKKSNNDIKTDDTLVINNSNSISNEINFIPLTVIDNVPELDYTCEEREISNKIEVVLNNQSLLINNELSENSKATDNKHNNSTDESNLYEIKNEFINNNLSININPTGIILKNSSDESNKYAIKTELIDNSDTTKNEKQCAFQNISDELTNDNHFSTTDTNKLLLDENITIKSEVMENVPESCADVSKKDVNESEKQLINKWTIDEDKIILQTCKRVEDTEVLLETINRRIPQRSVSEVNLFSDLL